MWRYLSIALWNRVTGGARLLEKLSSFMWEPGVQPKRGAACQPPTHPQSKLRHTWWLAHCCVHLGVCVSAGDRRPAVSPVHGASKPPGVSGLLWFYSLSCSLCVFLQHEMAWVTRICDCSCSNGLRRGRIGGDVTLSRADCQKWVCREFSSTTPTQHPLLHPKQPIHLFQLTSFSYTLNPSTPTSLLSGPRSNKHQWSRQQGKEQGWQHKLSLGTGGTLTPQTDSRL